MKLYFRNPGCAEEFLEEFATAEECCEYMNAYLKEREYEPPYWRIVGGKEQLMIDFGSYVSFFFVRGITFDLFIPGYRKFYDTWEKRKNNGK